MRKVKAIEADVLTRPGRYKKVADNLQVKEVWVGDGERRRRYVLGLNPQEAERRGGTAMRCSMRWPPNWR
jgi:hypothetical protein